MVTLLPDIEHKLNILLRDSLIRHALDISNVCMSPADSRVDLALYHRAPEWALEHQPV